MLLSEHVHCVAIAFKMTEWAEQQMHYFCIKLEHSSMETIQMIQGPVGMGNKSLAPSSGQCAYSCIRSHAVSRQNIKSPRWLSPPTAQFGVLWLLAFPKTKITFEREKISDCLWDSGRYSGAADGNWENCMKSQGAYFEGQWGIIVLCTMFVVSWSYNKCFYFP